MRYGTQFAKTFALVILAALLGIIATIYIYDAAWSARARAIAIELRANHIGVGPQFSSVRVGPCGLPRETTDSENHSLHSTSTWMKSDHEFALAARKMIAVGGPVYLDVCRVPLSRKSLVLLRQMPRLRHLALEQCGVADADLELLVGIRLEGLVLAEKKITDNALTPLSSLTGLRYLGIHGGARLSEEALRWLRQRLPHCRVVYRSPVGREDSIREDGQDVD